MSADLPVWGEGVPTSRRKVSWGPAVSDTDTPAARTSGDATQQPAAARSRRQSADQEAPMAAAPTSNVWGDLFTATTPPTSDEAGLDGLFGPPADTPAPSAALEDLFATEQQPESTLEKLDGFAEVFADTAPSSSPPLDVAPPTFTAEPAPMPETYAEPTLEPPAPATASPFAAVGGKPDASPSSSARPTRGRVAEQRATAEAARAASVAPQRRASEQTLALAKEDRFARAEHYEPWVTRLLGLGAQYTEAQAFFARMVLTRDSAVDRVQRMQYQELLEPRLASAGIQIPTLEDLEVVFDIAYDELLGIGPLGPLWRDETVNDIMVSGPDKVTIQRSGLLEVTPVRFRDLEHLQATARRLGEISKDDRAISPTNPLAMIQLPGARVQFVWAPLAVSKVAISIRKFGKLFGMDDLLRMGSLTPAMRDFLAACVVARATIVISGGTGSGKTTFINALSESIPDNERVITIEDSVELQLRNTHVEALVTKEAASADDRHLWGQDELLKASLRLLPDRIIVGEIRDGKGCAVMLEAANTGHAGTLTTIHADNPRLALSRMAKLLRRVDSMPDDVARSEVATAINLVVQVTLSRGKRFVSHISAVDPESGETTDIFRGEHAPGNEAPTFRQTSALGPDTALGTLMLKAGQDPSVWKENS